MKEPFNLSKEEMELYSIMHNRWTLSKYTANKEFKANGCSQWLDERGNYFFILERDQVVKFMSINKGKFPKLKQRLMELGLLKETVKKGSPTRYYLKDYEDVKGIIFEHRNK